MKFIDSFRPERHCNSFGIKMPKNRCYDFRRTYYSLSLRGYEISLFALLPEQHYFKEATLMCVTLEGRFRRTAGGASMLRYLPAPQRIYTG